MADELTDLISTTAAEPAEVESDGQRIKAQSLADIIAADKYLKGQAALAGGKSAWGATRPARLVPPGTGLNDGIETAGTQDPTIG